MANIIEVRYLTDDRDKPPGKRNELVIRHGGNGDLYIATVPEGQGTGGKGVRICTSGGAQFAVPGLTRATSDAFKAIANAEGDGITHIYDE